MVCVTEREREREREGLLTKEKMTKSPREVYSKIKSPMLENNGSLELSRSNRGFLFGNKSYLIFFILVLNYLL